VSFDTQLIDGYVVIRPISFDRGLSRFLNTRTLGGSSGNHLRAADGFMWEVPAESMIIRCNGNQGWLWRERHGRIKLARLPRWLICLTLQKRTDVRQCCDSVATFRRVRDVAIRPDKGYVVARPPSQLNDLPI
jgi:hypothetical protein